MYVFNFVSNTIKILKSTYLVFVKVLAFLLQIRAFSRQQCPCMEAYFGDSSTGTCKG